MHDRHWENENQARCCRAFLVATHLLLDRLDRELQRKAEMPLAYFKILACLAEAPGRSLRMSDLAARLHASKSRLSHAAARLEERGWLRRLSCPDDKRGAIAVLTDQGARALEQALPNLAQCMREQLFNHLTPAQLEQLRSLSEHIATHLCGPAEQDPRDETFGQGW